jgi:hypothetical protein
MEQQVDSIFLGTLERACRDLEVRWCVDAKIGADSNMHQLMGLDDPRQGVLAVRHPENTFGEVATRTPAKC